jgi:hypothetical protein
MYLKHVQSLALDFKFYIIQRFNIFIKSFACFNHKSHIFQPIIIMYHTKVLKIFRACVLF